MVRRNNSRSRTASMQRSSLNITEGNPSSSKVPRKNRKPAKTNIVMVGSKAFKVNVKIIREVRRLQLMTSLLIPKLCFARIVREILGEYQPDVRVQTEALAALQEAAEAYMVQLFEDSYLCALHSRRITLFPRDMQLALRLRGEWHHL